MKRNYGRATKKPRGTGLSTVSYSLAPQSDARGGGGLTGTLQEVYKRPDSRAIAFPRKLGKDLMSSSIAPYRSVGECVRVDQ